MHIKEQLAWHAWNYRCPRCRGRGWCGCSKQNPPIRHHTRTMALSALTATWRSDKNNHQSPTVNHQQSWAEKPMSWESCTYIL